MTTVIKGHYLMIKDSTLCTHDVTDDGDEDNDDLGVRIFLVLENDPF